MDGAVISISARLTQHLLVQKQQNGPHFAPSCDGNDAKRSWNCGVEGATNDSNMLAQRQKQAKNLLTIWAISQGTPMLLMGDEVLRSQRGNNNAYCQNNELSWFDWDAVSNQQGFLRFVKGIINFIQTLHIFKHDHPLIVTPQAIVEPAITWHGTKLGQPDWAETSHSLAFTLRYQKYGELLHIMLNAFYEPLTFELPPLPRGYHWKRVIDTGLDSPEDFYAIEQAPQVNSLVYEVAAYASVVLFVRG